MKRDPTPWRAWIGAAAAMGVTPAQFWRLSLAEWRALTAPPRANALPRADFVALAHAFPDKT